jgi:hypothetical protein
MFNQKCSIMQNKPNFQKAKMKLNFYSAKDYENKPRLRTPKNKPNQTQFYPPPAVSKGTLAYSGNSKRRTSFAGMTITNRFLGFAPVLSAKAETGASVEMMVGLFNRAR